MNILVTLNDNYVRPLLIMLESLFDHETEQIDVYLLYSDITEENRGKIREFIEARGHRFFPIFVGDDAFRDAPICMYFTREMYFRLLCAQLLPDTVDRILYLDPDILIRKSVAPLYETEFDGHQMAAIEDFGVNHMHTDKKLSLGFPLDETYVNSGVLLLNVAKMRETVSMTELMKLLEAYSDRIVYPDQDLINLYFRGDILFVSTLYNYNPGYHSPRVLLRYAFGIDRGTDDPVIVHFVGKTKPWHVSFYGKYFYEYFRYLKPRLLPKERFLFLFKPFVVVGKLTGELVAYFWERLNAGKQG